MKDITRQTRYSEDLVWIRGKRGEILVKGKLGEIKYISVKEKEPRKQI